MRYGDFQLAGTPRLSAGMSQARERAVLMAAGYQKTRTPGIFKRGNRYVVVWRHRGRQHKKYFATMAEARKAKGERQAGDTRPPSRVGFAEYYDGWIEIYAGRTWRGFSERSRSLYRRAVEDHALPDWKTWKLTDVEPADVRQLYGQLRKRGVSTSRLKTLRAALSTLFATAVEDNLCPSNPISGVRIPAPLSEEPENRTTALKKAELAMLLAGLPENWRLFFEFLTHTGLRISEVIGLNWEHLDLGEHPQVKVREQLYQGERRRLKSRDGRRDIPLSPGMKRCLLARRRDSYRGPDSPVFASKAGTPLQASNIYRRVLAPTAIGLGFKREIEVDGEKRIRSTISFHSFRHTCASLLFEDGRNIKQVQEWLGHADPSFTLKIYVHLMDRGIGDADFLDAVTSQWATDGQHESSKQPKPIPSR